MFTFERGIERWDKTPLKPHASQGLQKTINAWTRFTTFGDVAGSNCAPTFEIILGLITLVAFRATFGLLFGIVVMWVQRVRLPRSMKTWSALMLLGMGNVALPFLLISWGEQSIDSGVASIWDATAPLFFCCRTGSRDCGFCVLCH